MKKSAAARYSPRTGELLVEFLDWFYAREQLLEEGQEPWDLDEALEYFGMEKNLAPYELYQVAVYLSKKGYPIKAEEFHPEAIPSDEEEVSLEGIAQNSIFDKYFNAIKGERYEEAHQVYQQMSPSEKQVIQDQSSRRKKSMSNVKKTAQVPDAESAIEKQIPVEPVAEGPQESEIAEAIQTLLDQADDLEIPPQLSIPLAVSFDYFSAGKGNVAALNTALRKVLDFLEQQGTPAESIEALLQEQQQIAGGVQRLLRIADIADEQGWSDIADGITEIIKVAVDTELQRLFQQETKLREELESLHSVAPQDVDRDHEQKIMMALDDVQDRILFKTSGPAAIDKGLAKAREGLEYIKKQRGVILKDLTAAIKQDNAKMVSDLRDMMDVLENEERKIRSKYKKEDLEAFSTGVVEEAQELVSPTTLLGKFKKALMKDNFEEAGGLMEQMSGEEKVQAIELAKKYHTAASLRRLFQVGKALFDQKRYSEANTIGKIVRAQMMALPDDMQGQVILVLVPGGGEDLPQAFKGQEEISSKMEGMAKRLNPMVEEEEGCMPVEMNCSMPPATVAKLLSVADALDAKGLTVEASKIDAWLQKVALIIKAVRKAICPDCGADFMYYVGKPERYCVNCRRQREKMAPQPRKHVVVPPKEQWTKGGKSLDKITVTAVRKATCPDCGADFMYYVGKPERYCVNCRRQREQMAPQPRKPVVVPPKEQWTKGGESLDKIIEAAEKEHGGKPAKVVEIADAIRRDTPGTTDEAAYRMAWETYCSYTNPGHEGCTEKGKSHRESPKPYDKAAKSEYVSEEGYFKGKEGSGERWDSCIKHFTGQGKSKESAEKLCGYIKSRKGSLLQ